MPGEVGETAGDVEHVVAGAALHEVVSGPAVDLVEPVARAGHQEGIIPGAADQRVIAVAAVEGLARIRPGDLVVAGPAVDLLDVGQRGPGGQVDDVIGAGAVDDVIARAAVDLFDAR